MSLPAKPRRFEAGAILVVIALATSACQSAQQGPRVAVELGSSTHLTLAVSDVAAGQPYAFGSMMLCMTETGTAQITAVTISQPRGAIHVDAFAVRPNPFVRAEDGLGGERETLTTASSEFVPTAAQRVSGVCPGAGASADADNGSLSELGVQVSWDGKGQLAGGSALELAYEVNGAKEVTTIPFAIYLCAATCPDHPEATGPPGS